MTEPEERGRMDAFYRFLTMVREQNDAGEISGVMISLLNDTDNWCSSERSGYIFRRERLRDVDQLTDEVKRNPNFAKVLRRGRPRPVTESERRRTELIIKGIEREKERTPIEGASALVYRADGTTLAFSSSHAPQSSHLRALRNLEDVAWGERNADGGELVASGGPIDYKRFLTPTPEAEALARELGDELPKVTCSCGAPMRLTSGRPRPQAQQDVTFGCTRCVYYRWVSIPSAKT